MTAGIFAEWQPRYAAHGVATFPVAIVDNNKRPATSGYMKTGLRGSGQLAIKFAAAQSFGFACGSRNRVTVVDMDSTDPAIVAEGERLFGPSPLLWRTGGGKFAAAYRHHGEARRIRPIPSVPIDLLGGGFCVAPPSAGALRPYEIIRGSLDDLDRLPVARIPEEVEWKIIARHDKQPPPLGRNVTERIPEGIRNVEMFKYCKSVIGYCDTLDQLIDAARTYRDGRLELLPPVTDAEVAKTCKSVWDYQGGRRRVMSCIVEHTQYQALLADHTVFAVFAYIAAENGPNSEFMIADGLAASLGWPRRAVPAARNRMLDLGLIERVGRRGKTGPFLYRWRVPPP